MLKQIVRLRVGLVILLGILFVCSDALAMGNSYRGNDRRGDRRDYRSDDRHDGRGERHYYRDGRWYRRDSRGHDVTVADIVIGAIAESLPPRHETIIIQNTPYYYDNVHYYRQAPDNTYIVVEPPRR